jgi:type I restriction enzyme R subunit
MEMLENSIKKYQNKILTAAEVIEELIELANSIKNKDRQDKDTGLTNEELAFYYAIAENESAKEVLGNEVLRELAVYLSEVVKNNATIDWTIKESVRAKLKVMVKRALRKFGYPPDLQKLATDTVLKQAELLASHWTK